MVSALHCTVVCTGVTPLAVSEEGLKALLAAATTFGCPAPSLTEPQHPDVRHGEPEARASRSIRRSADRQTSV